jgi:hypothetical protein
MMPLVSSLSTRGVTPPAEIDARRTGAEAFVFGFPLLLATTTMRQATNVATLTAGQAPTNRFAHLNSFPDAGLSAVVAANANTLYSLAWLDLTPEPIVLNVPDTEGRSYLVSLMSAWTEVITCLGPRTSATTGGFFALVGPSWKGPLPDGLQRVDAPTNAVLVAGHIHARGLEDLNPARAIQQKLTLVPLAAHDGCHLPLDRAIDERLASEASPFQQLTAMGAEEFLTSLATEMGDNPPAARDGPILKRLAALGVQRGQSFDWVALSDEIRDALETGLSEGKKAVAHPPRQEQLANGWQTLGAGLGAYGSDYLRRAQIANLALGAAPPEDASFPITATDGAGRPTNGAHRYMLRFEPGELPPVGALWSLAIYDMDQLLVPNPIDRYALGDRDDLELGPDGSLEIVIQHDRPDGSDANWLPAPEGDFYLMLHMYWPSQRVLDGRWTTPPVQRVD